MAEGSPNQAIPNSGFNNNVFSLGNASSNTPHAFAAPPKLSIKLEDNNFLLSNQQVEGIIISKATLISSKSRNPSTVQLGGRSLDQQYSWRIWKMDGIGSNVVYMASFHVVWISTSSSAHMQAFEPGMGSNPYALLFAPQSKDSSTTLWVNEHKFDVVLDGLPEEYNSFVMMIYGHSDTIFLSEIEALLLVQEVQFDKHR